MASFMPPVTRHERALEALSDAALIYSSRSQSARRSAEDRELNRRRASAIRLARQRLRYEQTGYIGQLIDSTTRTDGAALLLSVVARINRES